jgi:hypothetical protein
MRTVQRWNPEAPGFTRKIEGPEIVYDYLAGLKTSIDKGIAPLLVDCLNCEMGCNGGPATLCASEAMDEVEARVEQRSREMQRRHLKLGPLGRKRTDKAIKRLLRKEHPTLSRARAEDSRPSSCPS